MTQQAKLIECHPVFHNIDLLIKMFHPSCSPTNTPRKFFDWKYFSKVFNRDLHPFPTYDNFISLILLFCIFFVRKYAKVPEIPDFHAHSDYRTSV